jgi:FkbM family methyltransferase
MFVQLIEEIMEINKCHFTLLNNAYASDDSFIEFYPHERPISGTTMPQKQREYSEFIEIESVSIETIQQKFDIENFVLVSDIEGAEHGFIRDEIDLLESNCRVIIMELHPEKEVGDGTVMNGRNQLESSTFELIDQPEPDRGFYIYKNTSM